MQVVQISQEGADDQTPTTSTSYALKTESLVMMAATARPVQSPDNLKLIMKAGRIYKLML